MFYQKKLKTLSESNTFYFVSALIVTSLLVQVSVCAFKGSHKIVDVDF